MTMSELVAAMRLDLGDTENVLFAATALTRCLIRALSSVNQDLRLTLRLVNGEIIPPPDGLTAELLLLLAESYACAQMRGKTANAVNVSSGDKRIERTNQAKYWAELEEDLLARYRQRIAEMSGGEFFITPPPFRPVLFEQGSEVIEYELSE